MAVVIDNGSVTPYVARNYSSTSNSNGNNDSSDIVSYSNIDNNTGGQPMNHATPISVNISNSEISNKNNTNAMNVDRQQSDNKANIPLLQTTVDTPVKSNSNNNNNNNAYNSRNICRFYIQNNCNKGNDCKYEHQQIQQQQSMYPTQSYNQYSSHSGITNTTGNRAATASATAISTGEVHPIDIAATSSYSQPITPPYVHSQNSADSMVYSVMSTPLPSTQQQLQHNTVHNSSLIYPLQHYDLTRHNLNVNVNTPLTLAYNATSNSSIPSSTTIQSLQSLYRTLPNNNTNHTLQTNNNVNNRLTMNLHIAPHLSHNLVPTLATIGINATKKRRARDVCRYWHKGTCRYGSQCSFLHPAELDPRYNIQLLQQQHDRNNSINNNHNLTTYSMQLPLHMSLPLHTTQPINLQQQPQQLQYIQPINNNVYLTQQQQQQINNNNNIPVINQPPKLGRLLYTDSTCIYNNIIITEKSNVIMDNNNIPLVKYYDKDKGYIFVLECTLNKSIEISFTQCYEYQRSDLIYMIRTIIQLLEQYNNIYDYEINIIDYNNKFIIQVLFGQQQSQNKVIDSNIDKCTVCNVDSNTTFLITKTTLNQITLTVYNATQYILSVSPLQHISRLSDSTDEQINGLFSDIIVSWNKRLLCDTVHTCSIKQSNNNNNSQTHISCSTQLNITSLNALLSNFNTEQSNLWQQYVTQLNNNNNDNSKPEQPTPTESYIPLTVFAAQQQQQNQQVHPVQLTSNQSSENHQQQQQSNTLA